MKFTITSGSPEKQRSACVIAGVFEGRRLTNAAKALDEASGGAIANHLRRGDISGRPGSSLLLHGLEGTLADRILLIGCGRERQLEEGRFREIAGNAASALRETGAGEAVSYLTELNIKGRDVYWKARQLAEVAEASAYRFDEFKSKKQPPRRAVKKLTLGVPSRRELPEGERGAEHGQAIAAGMAVMRDLANRPANHCTPTYLAEQAEAFARQHKSVRTTVLEEADMERLGMGSLLSVASGSRQPAKLITMEYTGDKAGSKPYVLVGKGVTFDTGGISIKPAQAMDEMKYDMSGAASVFGTLAAVVQLKLPINVVGVVPATENMPDGQATKPGDVVTSMSGLTIEILNTDAEGRLILCDALTYAGRFEPATVIDIATLTGACIIALGSHASGLMSNNPGLANDLLNAGRTAWDRVWQLPLWDEYQKQIDSPFADIANVGGREAGTITAGCFLARFTEKYRWAHIDVAGTAYRSGNKKGSTGRPVPALVQYLLDRAGA